MKIVLNFDDKRRAYWLDHDGKRWWLECRLLNNGECAYDLSSEAMAIIADAIVRGKLTVELV